MYRNKKKFLYLVISIFYIYPFFAFAAVQKIGDLMDTILNLLGAIVPILTTVAVVFFLWSVVLFVQSAGNEEKRNKAKMGLVSGVVAITIMFSLWGMVAVLSRMFGVSGGDSPVINNTQQFIVDTPY